MKRLIVINSALLIVLNIIPTVAAAPVEKNKNIPEEIEIVEMTETTEEQTPPAPAPVETPEVTSRSVIETRIEELPPIQKNLELATDSDLRVVSNLTAVEFDKMLAGTALEGLGTALEQAEKEHNVNGLYLMGLACLESSYGQSRYARERNNLVGWNAVDSNPNKATFFTSKAECILFVANRLKINYLSEDGKYFSGYTATAINKKYSSDKKHANKIVSIVNKLKNKL